MVDLLDYRSEGNVSGNLVTLILSVGIAIVIYIFMGVIASQTYNLSYNSIKNTTITNSTIRGYVFSGIGNGFSAYSTTGSYLPLVVLAVVIGLVLTAILSSVSMNGVGGAGAL